MAIKLVTALVSRVETILFDETHIRWPRKELVDCYNDAIKAVINRRPDACAMTVIAKSGDALFPLVVGTKQTIPDDGLRFVKLVRNVRAGGSMRAVTPERTETLDRNLPNWHASSADDVQHFVHDPMVPKVFYVYPGATANTELEAVYTRTPADVEIGAGKAIAGEDDTSWASSTKTIDVDDVYANALVEYMLYRAYSKTSETHDLQRAASHLSIFESALGSKSKADAAVIQGQQS